MRWFAYRPIYYVDGKPKPRPQPWSLLDPTQSGNDIFIQQCLEDTHMETEWLVPHDPSKENKR